MGSALVTTGFVSMIAVAPAAAELTRTSVDCDAGLVSLGGIDATACEGAFSGNDTNSSLLDDLNSGSLFSSYYDPAATWSLAAKSDDAGSWLTAPETTGGTWGFTLPEVLNQSTFVLSLKAANSFSTYLFKDFDFGGVTTWEGLFSTLGVSVNGGGNAQDLSHASLYFASGGSDPAAVPEPAALLGLAVVGGGLSLSRRRK
ncbi:MAG: PEP-CTERM sorting domain-containing protein [Chroococcales cyanobacterium]